MSNISYESLLGLSNITGDVLQVSNIVTKNIQDQSLSASSVVFTDLKSNLISNSMSNGQLIIGSAGAYKLSTLSTPLNGNISIINGPGSISLNITSTPTFQTVTVVDTVFTANLTATNNITVKTVNTTNLVASNAIQGLNIYATNNILGVNLVTTNNVSTNSLNVADISCGNSINSYTLTTNILKAISLTPNQLTATYSDKTFVSVPMANGTVCIGNGSSYSVSTITAGSSGNQTVINGPGSITIDISQNPNFSGTVTASALSTSTLNLSGYLTAGGLNTSGMYTVNNSMTASQINSIISNSSYNYIFFTPGFYYITAIFVARDNIILDGNMSFISMAKYGNNPNIAVGNLDSSTPTVVTQNVMIKNFNIDGRNFAQSNEYMSGKSWVTNCCIFSTKINHLIIDNCIMTRSISGGTTTTYNSTDLTIRNCNSYNHSFDSYTAYGSTNLKFENNLGSLCTNGAGISIDQNCQYVTITGNNFTGNKLAIFARWCNDVTITGNTLSGNTQQGLFIAGNYDGSNIGPNKRWVISSNTITNNGNQGLYLQSCQYFTVTGNTICNNAGNGINIARDNATYGLCSYNNFSGNVSCNNTGSGTLGFYNDSSNSYANGARFNLLSLNTYKNNSGGDIYGDLTAYTVDDDTQLNTNQITLHNNSGNYTQLNSNSTGNCNITFPNSNGASNNLIQTDGSGHLSYTANPSVSTVNFTNADKFLALYAAPTTSYSFQFPANPGIYTQLLSTDGFGNTSWVSPSTQNVVQGVSNTAFNTTSFNFAFTPLNATITLRSTTSKVLITVTGTMYSVQGCFLSAFRNFTEVSGNTQGLAFNKSGTPTNVSFTFLDSPGTAGGYTYSACISTTGTAYWNTGVNTNSVIILQEIM